MPLETTRHLSDVLRANTTVCEKIAHEYKKSSGNIIILLKKSCKNNFIYYIFYFTCLFLQIFPCKNSVFLSTIILTQGEESVQNRVEPPILLSRLMTFVLATALVVLAILCITVYNMFPLNRPQVFFLTTTIRDNQDIQLAQMLPKDTNTDQYEKAFIREYIRHRNEIFANAGVMHKKWNAENSVVHTMSTPDVYKNFTDTKIYQQIMNSNVPKIDATCNVNFHGAPMYMPATAKEEASYRVYFRYFCTDDLGQTTSQDYVIRLRIKYDEGTKIKWSNRIDNPLGIKVVEYTVLSGNDDPLDTQLK